MILNDLGQVVRMGSLNHLEMEMVFVAFVGNATVDANVSSRMDFGQVYIRI